MKTILISDFKARCIAVLKEVERSGEPVIVTLRGRPMARVEPFTDTTTQGKKLGVLKGHMRIRRDLVRADTSGDWGNVEVKYLLDTHVWIWSQDDKGRLGLQTRKLLLDAGNENHVCTVSALELARLVSMGAIELSISLQEWVDRALQSIQARTVVISHETAVDAYALPEPFHKDPADRLHIAAARCHELVLLTADERILAYKGVRSRDARK